MTINKLTFALVLFLMPILAYSQVGAWDPDQRCVVDINGNCTPNPVNSSLAFLSIIPDARGGALGDAGLTTSPDASSIYYNASKLAFAEKEAEITATYTPWLQNLGLTDVFVAYVSGYKKIDELSSFGFNFGFFNLGEIDFTDINGNPRGSGRPREFSVGLAYGRKLSENFALGFGGKFFLSNLATGQMIGGTTVSTATGFAADISMTYNSNPDLEDRYGSNFSVALAISNVGSGITYTNALQSEPIPTNLGLGVGYKINLDEYNSVAFMLDLNKLLIPTPIPSIEPFLTDGFDNDGNGVADFREGSIFGNIISSFNDAPGGFREELREWSTSLGVEYWYDNQFAVRAGYFREHPLKGDRNFLTIGVGLKYNIYGFDISYLAPTNIQRGPLDNTLRFSFTFDLGVLGNDANNF